ncbi:MAG: SufD family Fe-S cluster assembly protein [Ruminococcaceae bacterium]|nr:SufD family Fe-S cluster assembly protein [Oscillospiraceae bacterium]
MSEVISALNAGLLEKIAGISGPTKGAYNIRIDSGCSGRSSTENIEITPKTDKKGIDIKIKAGTKNESCHIPVLITKTGLSEMVYNDFYVGDDCDVTIVAGCGIHNSGCNESRHDGIHTFYIGKNSKVKYVEKHYGEGDGNGGNIMNPKTVAYLEENAYFQMDTAQIAGIDSTVRDTKIVCGKGAETSVTERLMTHGTQKAESDMIIVLDGEDSKGRV